MGNAESGLVYCKLSKELPKVRISDQKNQPYFSSNKEREDFIDAVIAILSDNGSVDISDQEFKLIFNKDGEKEERITAVIVVIKNGSINSKIEAEGDGEFENEAFQALVHRVNTEFATILA